MKNITIIGTHHLDPKGFKRLESLLIRIKPDILALETSFERIRGFDYNIADEINKIELSLSKKIGHGKMLTFYGLNMTLLEIENYEFDATYKYSKQFGTYLDYIDLPIIADDKNKYARGMGKIIVSNLKELLEDSDFLERLSKGISPCIKYFQEKADSGYNDPRSFEKYFDKNFRDREFKDASSDKRYAIEAIFSQKRNEYMAKQIELLAKKGNVAAVVGLVM